MSSAHSSLGTLYALGLQIISNYSFFPVFLFSYWKVTWITNISKLLKMFLLTKSYVVKLQLLIQIQTSKKYVLEKEWKNLDSFRIPTDKRDFRPWSLESKIMEPSTWLPPFFLQLFHLTEGRRKWLQSPCWILFRRMLAWKSQHYRMTCY